MKMPSFTYIKNLLAYIIEALKEALELVKTYLPSQGHGFDGETVAE